MSKIEILRAYVEANPEHMSYLLFEVPHIRTNEMLVGVIYCDDLTDPLDNHCDKCRDKISPFLVKGEIEGLDHYLIASVGPTKFERIRAGWRDSNGLDLRLARFV